MNSKFPAAVPEIPVSDMASAIGYYKENLGFTLDWGGDHLISGISKEDCRLFLTDHDFRGHYLNNGPVLIWINLDSKEQVDELHRVWSDSGARVVSPPESKPWGLHEFTVTDLDENFIRVFFDFSIKQQKENE